MKIRTDFVTNSSSSTFFVHKEATLVFLDSDNHYKFYQKKRESKVVEELYPPHFSKFVNWHYLMLGTKPTVGKMTTKAGLKRYAQYLIDNKKEAGDYVIVLDETEYRVGYGESIGNDFETCQDLIFSHLHPTLQPHFEGKHLFAILNASPYMEKFWFWIEKHRVTGAPEGDWHVYYVANDHGYHTETCYDILYDYAGRPPLDIAPLEPALHKAGFTAQAIQQMKALGWHIIYFAHQTKENDVLVYWSEEDDIVFLPVNECLRQFGLPPK